MTAIQYTQTLGAILEDRDPTALEALNPPHVHVFIPRNDESHVVIAFDAWGNAVPLFPDERNCSPIIYAFESDAIVAELTKRYHSLVVTAPHVD